MPFKDCLIFKGKIKKDGYGSMWSKYSHNMRNAHRVIYENYYGKIPSGMVIMHLCDNRCCVNLKHLKLGTYSDNIKDMHKKNRWCDRKGENHPLSKISNKDTIKIRNFYKSGLKQRKIANLFGLTQSCISRIINFKRRQYVAV